MTFQLVYLSSTVSASIAPSCAQSSLSPTILPTDVVPLPSNEQRETFGDNLQFRLWQNLPAKFYFNTSVETSLRNETNVYQSLKKRQLLRQITPFSSQGDIDRVDSLVKRASINDNVFRVAPNILAGWAFTPRTRAYANYFLIRDQLFQQRSLNALIQSVGGGCEHDFPLGSRANLQTQFQFRELYQNRQIPVFDYLPAITLTLQVTPRTIAYVNTLLQLRGKTPFVSPTREIDAFYSFGFVHSRGLWTLSAAATFLQNYRKLFGDNALLPINNDSWILDFEIARKLFKQVPVQAFVRAEPIYNFHSQRTPGLSGMDFRLYYGLRASLGKPPIHTSLKQIRQMIKQQNQPAEPAPNQSPGDQKNTSQLRFDEEQEGQYQQILEDVSHAGECQLFDPEAVASKEPAGCL